MPLLGLPKSFAPGSDAQLAAGQLLANAFGELTAANVELIARSADKIGDQDALVRVIKSLPVVKVRAKINRQELAKAHAGLNDILRTYPKQAESLLSSLLIEATQKTILALPKEQQPTVFSRGAALAELQADTPLRVIAARSVALKREDLFDSALSIFNPLHSGTYSHGQIVAGLRCLKPGDDTKHFLSADEIHNFVAYEARYFEAPNDIFSAVVASKVTRPETLMAYLQSPLAQFRQDVTATVLSHPNLDPNIANGEWEALFYGKRASLLTAMSKEQRLASAGHPQLDRHWRSNFLRSHNWDAARHIALDADLLSQLDTSVIASRAGNADRLDTKVFEALAKAQRLSLHNWQEIVNGSDIAKAWAATTALLNFSSVGMTLPVTEQIQATWSALNSHALARLEFDHAQVWADLPGRSAVPMRMPKKVMREMEMQFADVFVRVLPSSWDLQQFSPGNENFRWVFDSNRASSHDDHYVMGVVSKGSDDFLVVWHTPNDSDFRPHLAFDAKTSEALEPVPKWLEDTAAYVSAQWSRPVRDSIDLGGLAI